MTIYIFKRMMKSGKKTIIREIEGKDFDLARDICTPHNNKVRYLKNSYWLEWTEDKEYCKN